MPSVNKAILIGNLGRDPEIRYIPWVRRWPVFRWRLLKADRNGTRSRTDWRDLTVWGKQAELCSQSVRRGAKYI